MNLEDLAKKTINEVSSIMEEQRKQSEIIKDCKHDNNTQEHLQECADKQALEDKISLAKLEEEQIIQSQNENFSTEDKNENYKKEFFQNENQNLVVEVQNLNEDIFLKRLRERILVLFEGLNSIKEEELESRLNLTLNFLEFLLANIEDKLKK